MSLATTDNYSIFVAKNTKILSDYLTIVAFLLFFKRNLIYKKTIMV